MISEASTANGFLISKFPVLFFRVLVIMLVLTTSSSVPVCSKPDYFAKNLCEFSRLLLFVPKPGFGEEGVSNSKYWDLTKYWEYKPGHASLSFKHQARQVGYTLF